jgi:hypothetical protein
MGLLTMNPAYRRPADETAPDQFPIVTGRYISWLFKAFAMSFNKEF